MRNQGKVQCISVYSILVGDIIHIKPGDKVPADGIIIWSNSMQLDESSITGESKYVAKDRINSPFLLSGSNVAEGNGIMVACAVGIKSFSGKANELIKVSSE